MGAEDEPLRTLWHSESLHRVRYEPLIFSLFRKDIRHRVGTVAAADIRSLFRRRPQDFNLVGSVTPDGKHMPILDLDFPHAYHESTRVGHGHLYLNVPISRWRWVALMWGLYVGGVIEKGYFYWSLRRGANFARPPGFIKNPDELKKSTSPAYYGLFFKLRRKNAPVDGANGSRVEGRY